MSDRELVDYDLSKEAELKLELKDGKVVGSVAYNGKQMSAGMFVSLSPEQFIKQIEEMIPGNIDNLILDGLLAALKL